MIPDITFVSLMFRVTPTEFVHLYTLQIEFIDHINHRHVLFVHTL